MADRPKITLFVDIVSPFAYEAYYILQNDAVFRACDVSYVPIFLGGLMHMCGNVPPINIKNKATWIAAERLRWARAFGVPMHEGTPRDFPQKTLTAMRALCVVGRLDDNDRQDSKPLRLTQLLDEMFHQVWVERHSVQTVEEVEAVVVSVLGVEVGHQVMDEISTEGKAILASNTARAFDSGAFGLPWLECTTRDGKTEGFFGVDHLGQVARFLGLEKPRESGWRALL